jgi:hypothetical protein
VLYEAAGKRSTQDRERNAATVRGDHCRDYVSGGQVRLEIPDVPPSLNKTLNMHWRTRTELGNTWKALVRSRIIPLPINISQRKRVTITLHHSRFYDKDNAYGAVKVLVDALKACNLIWDDSALYLDLSVEQQKCSHERRHTVIEIEAA